MADVRASGDSQFVRSKRAFSSRLHIECVTCCLDLGQPQKKQQIKTQQSVQAKYKQKALNLDDARALFRQFWRTTNGVSERSRSVKQIAVAVAIIRQRAKKYKTRQDIVVVVSRSCCVDLLLQLLDVWWTFVELNWLGSFRLRNTDRKIRGGILWRSFSMTLLFHSTAGNNKWVAWAGP